MKRREVLRAAVAVTGVGLATAGCGDAGPATWHPAPHAGTSPSPSPSPSPLPAGATLPSEITRGPVNRAAIALTFHGQGDPASRRAAGRTATGGARVTVLAVGTWLEAQPTMARQILDGGHELGNHTQHHGAIARWARPQAYAEIDELRADPAAADRIVGAWFRPSQTQHATATIRAAGPPAGYPTCLSYDVDSLDYTDPPPATVVRNVLSAGGARLDRLHALRARRHGRRDRPAPRRAAQPRPARRSTMTELVAA